MSSEKVRSQEFAKMDDRTDKERNSFWAFFFVGATCGSEERGAL